MQQGLPKMTSAAKLDSQSDQSMHDELLIRHKANPILTCDDWPYSVHTVFNPGAIRIETGETVLLVRCEDFRGISHLSVAKSKDGLENWVIDPNPSLVP